MEFNKLLAEQQLGNKLICSINELLEKKISGLEIDKEPKNKEIIDFLINKISYYELYLGTVHKEKTTRYEPLNALFRETLAEVWG